jgi:hypothetical protein
LPGFDFDRMQLRKVLLLKVDQYAAFQFAVYLDRS